ISCVGRFAAFATFVLLVAGCTSGSGDASDDTFTPTSTYTPPTYSISSSPTAPSVATTGPNVRPGEKPPTLPAAGRTNTPAGAAVFASFYIRALDWGYATMDSTLAKSLFAPSCRGCARFASIIDSAREEGDHFTGGRISISRYELADNDRRMRAARAVDVTYAQQAVEQVAADGSVDARAPALTHLVRRVWLRWNSPGWTVVETLKVVHR
ncbi:MAG TPA: DUF6318 family protein, partial [Jatrophihabitans sp.]|nr:DUF6318 family protein [Jatrophihabitans sp.]